MLSLHAGQRSVGAVELHLGEAHATMAVRSSRFAVYYYVTLRSILMCEGAREVTPRPHRPRHAPHPGPDLRLQCAIVISFSVFIPSLSLPYDL